MHQPIETSVAVPEEIDLAHEGFTPGNLYHLELTLDVFDGYLAMCNGDRDGALDLWDQFQMSPPKARS